VIRRDADGDHVLLDELAVVDAGVVPTGHEVHSALIRRDIQQHVRIVARELPELRSPHRGGGQRRYEQAHASTRRVALPGDLAEGGTNIRERRSQ